MWIEVKDRLPITNRDVLTIDDSFIQEVCSLELYHGKLVWINKVYFCTLEFKEGITHWMELPKPPIFNNLDIDNVD